MGVVALCNGVVRSVPSAAALAVGIVAATASPTAYQDLAGFMSATAAPTRWQAHLVKAPQGSVHASTLRFSGLDSLGAGGIAMGDGTLVAIDRPFEDEADSLETVNRAGKGDLLMTRSPDSEPIGGLPNAGELVRPADLFSSREEAGAPRFARLAAGGARRDILMQTAHFLALPWADQPVGPAVEPPIMTASVSPLRDEKGPKATLVAYAATESHGDAPFDAVIGNGPANGLATPLLQPRARPEVTNLEDIKKWMAARSRGNMHDWADNVLPKSAYSRKQQACLAQGIYFEARGEPVSGQAAVAQVILNRVRNPAYPKTICGVVYQNKRWRNRCQFSFACDGIRDKVRSKKSWATAKKVASDVTYGRVWLPDVGDATHYHATYVKPRWARKMKRTDKVGRHIFYRTYGGGWS